MDLFGVVFLATVTSLGGGTLRDAVIGNTPVFWVSAPIYLLVAIVTAIVMFFLVRFYRLPPKALLVADTFGLAVFTVIGIQKTLALGIAPSIAIVMGVMTGVVGGILRDILAGEIPLVLRREIYATVSLCGAISFIAVVLPLQNQKLAALVSIAVTLSLRLSAIRWNLSLPIYISHKNKKTQ